MGGADSFQTGVYPNLYQKRVRDWWGTLYQDLFNLGLEFVWQDMTAPAIARIFGDMKSFPFRLILQGDDDDPMFKNKTRTAMELWHLYSYQLHKATFNGLNKLKGSDNQPGRDGRRNFIIGRGSYAGMKRYAGLWTGDNASTWDFLKISIAQVLGAGLTGIAIAGVDCGGFEPDAENGRWADPELLMRFYGAFFLLPWFRNHYNGQTKSGMQKKYFQVSFLPISNVLFVPFTNEFLSTGTLHLPGTAPQRARKVFSRAGMAIQLCSPIYQISHSLALLPPAAPVRCDVRERPQRPPDCQSPGHY